MTCDTFKKKPKSNTSLSLTRWDFIAGCYVNELFIIVPVFMTVSLLSVASFTGSSYVPLNCNSLQWTLDGEGKLKTEHYTAVLQRTDGLQIRAVGQMSEPTDDVLRTARTQRRPSSLETHSTTWAVSYIKKSPTQRSVCGTACAFSSFVMMLT